MTVTIEQAREVKQKVGDLARQAASVAGVGLTRLGGSYAVKVNLQEPSAETLPKQLNGVPIVYEVTGIAKKQRL